MRYMIHTYKSRRWYVEQYLIPSMWEQGITEDEIYVWDDVEEQGNLFACMNSFAACKGSLGGTWHLQDDVLICHDFAKRTREFAGDQVVCGFCCSCYEPGVPAAGEVFSVLMWQSSFPCIYIPNRIAAECAEWFYKDARYRPEFAAWVESRKKDDTFFYTFFVEKHRNDKAFNLAPHLVEHVDYIIGGSTINQWRRYRTRGFYFEDDYLVEELKEKVARARH